MPKDDELLQLLAERVPLTLLIDLLAPPVSEEVYAVERGDRSWIGAA